LFAKKIKKKKFKKITIVEQELIFQINRMFTVLNINLHGLLMKCATPCGGAQNKLNLHDMTLSDTYRQKSVSKF